MFRVVGKVRGFRRWLVAGLPVCLLASGLLGGAAKQRRSGNRSSFPGTTWLRCSNRAPASRARQRGAWHGASAWTPGFVYRTALGDSPAGPGMRRRRHFDMTLRSPQ